MLEKTVVEKIPVITIDGPSGSGKGTLCYLLANFLHWNYLDSGALYRLLGLAALKHMVALDNAPSLEILAEHLDIEFKLSSQNEVHFLLEGEDVTDAIRTEQIAAAASKVAALAQVRQALIKRQRAFRKPLGLVSDGRDMGTVVFPDAVLKVFLTASAQARAHRRYNQLKEKGIDVNLTQIIEEITERDARDQRRSVAPLRPAEDAHIIDTTDMSISEVFQVIKALVEKEIVSLRKVL